MKKQCLLFALITALSLQALCRQTVPFKWWNPAESGFPVMEGQAWPKEVAHFYDRLPARAKEVVRPAVWRQSRESAGLVIRFYSNAPEMRVRYTISGKIKKGMSGLDLHAMNRNGQWEENAGTYNFDGDTIAYHFTALKHDFLREYNLYLPYHQQVKWLEIGVPEKARITPLPVSAGKPVVVYGSAVTHSWVATMGRSLHTPVIDFGFAGCKRLDESVINLMGELEAKIYILECIRPLTTAVRILQQKRPGVPILIVDKTVSSRKVFEQLKASGVKDIFYTDPTGDATKLIRQILDEPTGPYTTTQACRQFRDRSYDWNERHQRVLRANKENPPEIVLMGNSIVQHWGGKLDKTKRRGEASWEKYFAPLGVHNFGFGGDCIENLLWRVYQGELDGYTAKQVVIMAGTNNIGMNTDEEIIAGLKLLLQAVKKRQPSAAMLVVGILPRRGKEERIAMLDRKMEALCGTENIPYIDPGKLLLETSGKVNESLFVDGLHPGADGYEVLAGAISPHMNKKSDN